MLPTGKIPDILRRLQAPGFTARLLLACIALSAISSAGAMAALVLRRFPAVAEAGYGDSYVLRTTRRYVATGSIYTPDPETVGDYSVYGPMLYRMLSVPVRLVQTENPFTAPRALELLLFLGCALAVAALTRKLVRLRGAGIWAFLFSFSLSATYTWVLQLRGDFAAIILNLTAIRLLLSRHPWAPVLAGLSAGFATQFKVSYVSATLAGLVWLSLQRKWSEAARFAGGVAVTSGGLYALQIWQEPDLLRALGALSGAVPHPGGAFGLIRQAVKEPVVVVGLVSLLTLLKPWPVRRRLAGLFALISLSLATLASVQAGSATNYLFEPMFALIPFCVLGLMHMVRGREASGLPRLILSGLALTLLVLPNVRTMAMYPEDLRITQGISHRLNTLRTAFQGLNVLSTAPSVTMISPRTVVAEPFLLAMMVKSGKVDIRPLVARVRKSEFDVIVVYEGEFHSIPFTLPEVKAAVQKTYQPPCVIERWSIYLPTNRPPPARLLAGLTAAGCSTSGPVAGRDPDQPTL